MRFSSAFISLRHCYKSCKYKILLKKHHHASQSFFDALGGEFSSAFSFFTVQRRVRMSLMLYIVFTYDLSCMNICIDQIFENQRSFPFVAVELFVRSQA